ncbi:nuclease-related domain-containing protein [Geodermatophilus amargosae]|uniref:nuclease-related domain-containing protein n=1 Tax=Geodermatophilus amargosae TaxID=1296565 RepID=UPI001587ED0A|nr:nuclease-related domain-containing protein [Geodermatophilus amargosae]
MLLIVSPFLVAAIALTAFTDGWLRWNGGVVLGAGLALFVVAWKSPPQHIERWGTGAEGERHTARALRPLLRSGWHVVHDLDWPRAGNVDHLVVGPAGVFVLDSKAWSGVVNVDDAGATITPRDNPDAAWTARGQRGRQARAGTAVARALALRSGLAVPQPEPVVVVWARFPQRVESAGGVTYVEGEHLADWLISRPQRLHRDQVAQLAAAADDDLLQISVRRS